MATVVPHRKGVSSSIDGRSANRERARRVRYRLYRLSRAPCIGWKRKTIRHEALLLAGVPYEERATVVAEPALRLSETSTDVARYGNSQRVGGHGRWRAIYHNVQQNGRHIYLREVLEAQREHE